MKQCRSTSGETSGHRPQLQSKSSVGDQGRFAASLKALGDF